MASDWQVQLDITAAEVKAEVASQAKMIQARIDQDRNISVLRQTNATDGYRTDVNAARSRADTRVQADALAGQGQLYGTLLVVGSRTLVVQAVTTAQSEAAKLLSDARIQSTADVASARIAADIVTQGADLLSAQNLSAARLAASRLVSDAQIAAQGAETAARIDSFDRDQSYRITVAGILADARIQATIIETDARVEARQVVASAQTAAAQTVAAARIEAERLTTDHRIEGVILTTDAQITAARTMADAQVYAETIEQRSLIDADRIVAAARIDALNLSADRRVSDIDTDARAYASARELAHRKYSSTSDLNAGKYSADRSLAGDVYAANSNLQGVIYTSDKEYQGAVDKSAIDEASYLYVAQRGIDKANYSALADKTRLEAKLSFEGDRYDEVWPYILSVLGLEPPQTPGLITSTSWVYVGGAIERPAEDAVVLAVSDSSTALSSLQSSAASSRLARLGFSPLARGRSVIPVGYAIGGLTASIGSEATFRDGCLEANADILADQQAVAVETFGAQQAALADASENLYRRQVGLVAAVARINA